jgi:spore maturation protein CgeB
VKIVVFGLSVSSSWGNVHATLWRGLIKGLGRLGHRVAFFERHTPEHASHRDLRELPGGRLILYSEWNEIRREVTGQLADADVAIVTSRCPDAAAATGTALLSPARVRCFYDLDTALTLGRACPGVAAGYLPAGGLGDFDLVLSCTGGKALAELKNRLGARHVAPLYAGVDPETRFPAPPDERFRADLSYLGSCSADRQHALEDFFVEPARRRPDLRFVIAGPRRPSMLPAAANTVFVPRVPLDRRSAFYCSSRLSLNVTRTSLAEVGYCPSSRLFEAAACGVPIVSDDWDGLDYFFEPGAEILVARTTGHVLDALAMPPESLERIARAGRERALAMHTADRRAIDLENILDAAISMPVEQAGAARE